MKIKQISVEKKDLKLTRPYTIAFKKIDAVENGIIRIVADNGLHGWGAFNPSFEVVGETLDNGLDALNAENLDWLIGRDLGNIKSIIAEVNEKFAGSICARVGLQMALYDLFTKEMGVPLVKYLGQRIISMPTSVTIGIKNVQETLDDAAEYIGKKFRILKVKLGMSVEEDIERMIRLREEAGREIELIVDANQGYNVQDLFRFCEGTAALNIQLIEQPFKKELIDDMRDLPAEIKRLIAADESLITPEHAGILASEPAACSFFNIKLMKCGGIDEGLSIARTAEKRGIGLMWGCNDESIISITAALHTAFSCEGTKFIDLDGSFDLATDVVKGGFFLKDGIMSISDAPGLGLIEV